VPRSHANFGIGTLACSRTTHPLAHSRRLRNNAEVSGGYIVRTSVGIAIVILCLVGFGSSAQAQTKLEVQYAISLLGLTIGHATLAVDIGAGQYSETASGHISGVASTLVTGEASASSRGTFANDRLLPGEFNADVKTNIETDTVRMKLDANGVTDLFVVVPPPPASSKEERVPLTEADRKGVVDPLSAALVIVAGTDDVLRPQSCPARLPIFDGRRRFDVVLTFKRVDQVKAIGYQGGAVVCAMHFTPIAGHRVGGTAVERIIKSDAVEVALASISGTRYLVPFQASIPTLVGTVRVTAEHFTIVGPAPAPPGGSQ
jgi:hypothetical protein